MEMFFLIAIVMFVILLFLLWRTSYTHERGKETIDAISLYASDQIMAGNGYSRYYSSIYDDMLMDYDKHLYSFWKMGRYSRVNKEYVEILKPYFERI